jgi:hypothetical protein
MVVMDARQKGVAVCVCGSGVKATTKMGVVHACYGGGICLKNELAVLLEDDADDNGKSNRHPLFCG